MTNELHNELIRIADLARHHDNCTSSAIKNLRAELERALDRNLRMTALELEIRILDAERTTMNFRLLSNRIEDACLRDQRDIEANTTDEIDDIEITKWELDRRC